MEQQPILVWNPISYAEIEEDEDVVIDLDDEWEMLLDELTDAMKFNDDGEWYAVMRNFGWRGIDGDAHIRATTGKELLQKILPNTPCIFKIYRTEEGLSIHNFHHDSMDGGEWYYITPEKEDQVDEEE
jgi:hypothetical protein